MFYSSMASLLLTAFLPMANALPMTLARRQAQQHPSDSGQTTNVNPNGSGGIAPQVWIPAVIVVLVLLGVFVLMWTRTNVFSRMRGIGTRVRNGPAASTREVTANQLAGTTNAARTTTTRPARPRRTRRTPSQISVTSLPVYMKEPGDQELVIFRGPEEMEDASHAIAEAREAEDDDESEQQSVVMRESPLYSPEPVPASSQNVSVMSTTSRRASVVNHDDAENADSSTAELMPRGNAAAEVVTTRHSGYSRVSADSADSTRPLSLAPSEAPPDYETEQGHTAIIEVPPGLSSSPESSPRGLSFEAPAILPSTLTTESTTESTPNRRSVFRGFNLFNLGSSSTDANANANSGTPPISSTSQGLAATDPSASGSTSPPAVRASTSTRHLRHRSSQSGFGSGSGSTFSVPFRTLSRQRSTTTLRSTPSRPNLTSPSALSINSMSISAPLSHTLTRTEIRYPRSGPTPEQIKLISSMESLGRFGVPYGRDAIEHAQNSRLTLALDPPPAFEGPSEENGSSADAASENVGDNEEAPVDEERPHSPPHSDAAQRTRSRSSEGSSNSGIDSTIPPRLLVPLFM